MKHKTSESGKQRCVNPSAPSHTPGERISIQNGTRPECRTGAPEGNQHRFKRAGCRRPDEYKGTSTCGCRRKNQLKNREMRSSIAIKAKIGPWKAVDNLLMGCSVCKRVIGKKQKLIKSNVCKYRGKKRFVSTVGGIFPENVSQASKYQKSEKPAQRSPNCSQKASTLLRAGNSE